MAEYSSCALYNVDMGLTTLNY